MIKLMLLAKTTGKAEQVTFPFPVSVLLESPVYFYLFLTRNILFIFTVTERLNSIDKRYQELQELAKLRKQRLLDALSLYKLFTEADGVEQWINEKEKMLVTMVPGKDIEDCEIMKHRFDGFDREMNANASRVAVVNQLARQLLHVEHPNR